MVTTPTSFEELRDSLHAQLDDFAPGQKRIAELLLSDPEGTALRTITQTAELARVHQSSLVRFAGALGLKGWPAIVALCRQQLTAEAQLVTRFGTAQHHDEAGELLTATVDHERDNLLRTFTRIKLEQWDRTVAALADARRVHVMGLRKCLPVAQLLSYLLRLVRPDVHLVAPVTGMIADELRDLEEGDVFVAISIHRYTAVTVAAFQEAGNRGLTTVALTDNDASPLARTADITYTVDCEGVTILRSISAFISLAQALATGVATRNGTRSREELLGDERLLKQFSAYWQ